MVKIKANISFELLRRHIYWRDQLIEELLAFIACWWPWWASALFAVSASVWRRFVGPNFLAIFLGYDSAQLDFCFPRNKSNSSRFPNRQNRNEASTAKLEIAILGCVRRHASNWKLCKLCCYRRNDPQTKQSLLTHFTLSKRRSYIGIVNTTKSFARLNQTHT